MSEGAVVRVATPVTHDTLWLVLVWLFTGMGKSKLLRVRIVTWGGLWETL